MKWLILLCATLQLEALPLFTQAPPNDNSFDIVDFRVADDFVLNQGGTLNSVSFWYQAQFQSDLAQVSYAIYNDAGGLLGSAIVSASAVPVLSSDVNSFFATFTMPDLFLNAGKYWLELHAGASLTDNSGLAITWTATADNATQAGLYSGVPSDPSTLISQTGFQQYSFLLDGTATPESANFLAATLGFAVFIFLRHITVRT